MNRRSTRKPSANRPKAAQGKKRGKRATAKSTRSGNATKLRIIGGDMRGRVVPYHGELFTRPMKDNIRENLFNILGPRIRGSLCFDLFAGTGALGFEALSRGVQSVTLIEQNRKAAQFIRETASTFGVDEKTRVLIGDTFYLARDLLAPPPDDTPWVVFLCPPYALWTESLAELAGIIRTVQENAPPGSILMAETERTFPHDQLPAADWDLRHYGGTTLAFTEPASKCGMLP